MNQSLPEEFKSIWIATTPATNFPEAIGEIEVDVVIIGGGIAGLNAGYFLKNQGLKVAVLEAGKIASGTSGNTTAKATSLHELKYAYLTKTFGGDSAQIYADSNQWAIFELENIIKKENISCDFYRAPSFTYTKTKENLAEIKHEVGIALKLGLPASFATSIPGISLEIYGAVKFDNQAYFHPRKYLLNIADLINGNGSFIFENSRAVDIKEEKKYCVVNTGKSILKAKFAIIATNFPFLNPDNIFSNLYLIRSFVIAATPASSYPEAMFIGTKSLDLSFRPHKDKKKEWLIIGARHDDKKGDINIDENFKTLAEVAEKNFKIKSINFKWGAADTMSLDEVPYIGKISEKILVTTGFSAWGMTTSFISAKILTDIIMGKKDDWQNLYDPKRLRR